MFVQFKPCGKSQKAYILKSFRKKNGKGTSTTIVEKLGTIEEIREAHPGVDPWQWAKDYAAELTRKEKEEDSVVTLKLNPSLSVRKGQNRFAMGGMLPLMPIYHNWLSLGKICKEISSRHKFSYNLDAILSTLLYGRILCPDSKLATLRKSSAFVNPPDDKIEDFYYALGILAEESDFIQKEVYRSTNSVKERDTGIVYYDCTNYYFEIEKADEDKTDEDGTVSLGLRKYGHSKENRPNPIVQVGLFMDAEGLPLAFCINPGNTPETQTIIPLEEKLEQNFDVDCFVCCTDGGLGSADMRWHNSQDGRHYITVQSLKDKKVNPDVQGWALEDSGWTCAELRDGVGRTIAETKALLSEEAFANATLYKAKFFKVPKSIRTSSLAKDSKKRKEVEMEEMYVVTYSQKYAEYQRATRAEQIARAERKIRNGETGSPKSPNDCRRFITETSYTDDGEVAENKKAEIDKEKIAEEARFDGLYCLATDMDDIPTAILRANHFRYEIEALFRVTKSDLESRAVYLQRPERIKGHFITCFLALLMLKKLQRMLDDKYTVQQLLETLRSMNYTLIESAGYIPAFNPDSLTDDIKNLIRQRIDAEIITKPKMRNIVKCLTNLKIS